jgi:methylenetetrahydrofolate reductase (NADPH)
VAASRGEIDDIVRAYWDAGIRHIVALRGDMPGMQGAYAPHPDGYRSTPELIAGIRKVAAFEVSVSFYPERHPDSPSHRHDIDLLKAKMDAGASRALGQFCFDNDRTARFRDEAVKAGITIPVVPGIMPTSNFRGVERMAGRCGASIPGWLSRAYDGLDEDAETRRIVAAAVLADQVQQLRARGFGQFHFYTLNQANLTYAACRILGVRPKE